MRSSHLILCCPLLLRTPIPPSITVFSNELTLRIRWPKYWFQLQHHSFQRTPRHSTNLHSHQQCMRVPQIELSLKAECINPNISAYSPQEKAKFLCNLVTWNSVLCSSCEVVSLVNNQRPAETQSYCFCWQDLISEHLTWMLWDCKGGIWPQ